MNSNFFDRKYFFGRSKSNYRNYNSYDNNSYWRPFLKSLKKYGVISDENRKERVLEIGCAFGFFLKRLQPYFAELYGVDISGFALQQAKKILPKAKLEVGDINKELNYPSNYFDCIVALDVLEHTKSVKRSLENILPALKNDGHLLISLPVKDSWAGKLFGLWDKDESHISILSLKDLENILQSLNLQIIQKRFFWNVIFFQIPGIPVDVQFLLKKDNLFVGKKKKYVLQ